MKLGLIVEGQGEVQALPIVVRRIVHEVDPSLKVEVLPPHRVKRGHLVQREELKRAVELLARKTGSGGAILVVLDADEDSPPKLAQQLLIWVQEQRADRAAAVVVAQREFEAWFVAAAVSLRGKRGLPLDLEPPPDPEAIRGAKEWLEQHMGERYRETVDQPAFASLFDINAARRACSFDKLFRDISRLLGRSAAPR